MTFGSSLVYHSAQSANFLSWRTHASMVKITGNGQSVISITFVLTLLVHTRSLPTRRKHVYFEWIASPFPLTRFSRSHVDSLKLQLTRQFAGVLGFIGVGRNSNSSKTADMFSQGSSEDLNRDANLGQSTNKAMHSEHAIGRFPAEHLSRVPGDGCRSSSERIANET